MATTGAAREDVVRTILTIDREFMDAVAAKDAERVSTGPHSKGSSGV